MLAKLNDELVRGVQCGAVGEMDVQRDVLRLRGEAPIRAAGFDLPHLLAQRLVHQAEAGIAVPKLRWGGMATNRDLQAPGALLAGAIILGTVGGVLVGESSAGFLIGLAAGLVVMGLFWLRDRKR